MESKINLDNNETNSDPPLPSSLEEVAPVDCEETKDSIPCRDIETLNSCKDIETSKPDTTFKEELAANLGPFVTSCSKMLEDLKLNNGTWELTSIQEHTKISTSLDENEEMEGCQTPRESVFDSFAPGPKELILAPKKKMPTSSIIPFRRQLTFESKFKENMEFEVVDGDSAKNTESKAFDAVDGGSKESVESPIMNGDSALVDFVSNSLHDLHVSDEGNEISNENSGVQVNASEVLMTPTGSDCYLTDIEEHCPDAPKRPLPKARRLNENGGRQLF